MLSDVSVTRCLHLLRRPCMDSHTHYKARHKNPELAPSKLHLLSRSPSLALSNGGLYHSISTHIAIRRHKYLTRCSTAVLQRQRSSPTRVLPSLSSINLKSSWHTRRPIQTPNDLTTMPNIVGQQAGDHPQPRTLTFILRSVEVREIRNPITSPIPSTH